MINYKKKSLAVILSLLLILSSVLLTACGENEQEQEINNGNGGDNNAEDLVDDTKSEAIEDIVFESLDQGVSAVLLDRVETMYLRGEASAEGHVVLESVEVDSGLNVYLITMVGNYGFENGVFTKVAGSGYIPAVMTFKQGEEGFRYVDTKWPTDGSGYTKSIEEMFPSHLVSSVLDTRDYEKEIEKQEKAYAQNYLKSIDREGAIISDNIERELVKLEFDKSEDIEKILRGRIYPYWNGTTEAIEDGVRVIHAKIYEVKDERNGILTYRKTTEKGSVIEEIKLTVESGKATALDYKNEYESESKKEEFEKIVKDINTSLGL